MVQKGTSKHDTCYIAGIRLLLPSISAISFYNHYDTAYYCRYTLLMQLVVLKALLQQLAVVISHVSTTIDRLGQYVQVDRLLKL